MTAVARPLRGEVIASRPMKFFPIIIRLRAWIDMVMI
jgi:hypothetical protein